MSERSISGARWRPRDECVWMAEVLKMAVGSGVR
jgi:hypothetical protein